MRRQGRAENLAADRHQGLRAVHSDHQDRHRRHLRADGGADVVAVSQAVAGRGYKKPIIGGGTNYDEFILPSMDDGVIGDVSSFMYSAALDTPKNIEFVKKYRAKYGKVPSYYSEANYTTAQWIDET